MALSSGTGQREAGLEALYYIPRLKQEITLDKRCWEIEKVLKTFLVPSHVHPAIRVLMGK